MRALLRHSYETVPLYREQLEHTGFHPDQFRTLEDLKQVPDYTEVRPEACGR